jgi:hypothetical protein
MKRSTPACSKSIDQVRASLLLSWILDGEHTACVATRRRSFELLAVGLFVQWGLSGGGFHVDNRRGIERIKIAHLKSELTGAVDQ